MIQSIHPEDVLLDSTFQFNSKNKTDGLFLLKAIKDDCIATCFFDPQYRGVLDKLSYGNEKECRSKDRSHLPQMTEETIISFIREINRILKPTGHLFLWVDKFHLCEGIKHWLDETDLEIVDMITWDKGKIGLGYRTRRKSEHCIVIQKKPKKAKGVWTIHNIPDVWLEKTPKKHPHSKPLELQKTLIEATTTVGDIVVDPASGGYSVMEACFLTNRTFLGGDLIFGEEE